MLHPPVNEFTLFLTLSEAIYTLALQNKPSTSSSTSSSAVDTQSICKNAHDAERKTFKSQKISQHFQITDASLSASPFCILV